MRWEERKNYTLIIQYYYTRLLYKVIVVFSLLKMSYAIQFLCNYLWNLQAISEWKLFPSNPTPFFSVYFNAFAREHKQFLAKCKFCDQTQNFLGQMQKHWNQFLSIPSHVSSSPCPLKGSIVMLSLQYTFHHDVLWNSECSTLNPCKFLLRDAFCSTFHVEA